MVAIEGLLVPQTPPGVGSENGTSIPVQTGEMPEIAAGRGVTVIVVSAGQVPFMYEMVTVPTAPPVTTPVLEPTEAMVLLALLHTPPGVGSVSVICAPPAQTLIGPLIAKGDDGASGALKYVTENRLELTEVKEDRADKRQATGIAAKAADTAVHEQGKIDRQRDNALC